MALDEERISDIVLAVNEALANAAEFAYRTFPEAGTVSIEARHGAARLVVEVSDNGVWYDEDPVRSRTRGRGIPLMKTLSDGATIERRPEGTACGCGSTTAPPRPTVLGRCRRPDASSQRWV